MARPAWPPFTVEIADMSLTARDMQQLDDHAREIAAQGGGTYLADALGCLLDTRDPTAALDLLKALWGSGHGRRANQRAGLEEVGLWLEQRIQRELAISVERLALELGWLRRFIKIHDAHDRNTGHHDDPRDPRDQPTRAPFGASIDRLRARREAALARNPAAASAPPSEPYRDPSASATPPVPDHLPDSFEARFASWQDAIEAFRRARDRRKQGKPPKDRLLDIVPVATELRRLAGDLACSMLDTDGMLQLIDHGGDLPSFHVTTTDLVARDGKRIPSRIAIAPAKNRSP
jgi:hypothetical protein